MKAIRFKNKSQTNTYNRYTIIAVVLSILIFSGLDVYINKQVAYLLVTILSAFSIYSAIKKASKEFEEIIINESSMKFYFQNKMKEPISISKENIAISIDGEIIKFDNVETKQIIGQANKSKLENDSDWETLLLYTQLS